MPPRRWLLHTVLRHPRPPGFGVLHAHRDATPEQGVAVVHHAVQSTTTVIQAAGRPLLHRTRGRQSSGRVRQRDAACRVWARATIARVRHALLVSGAVVGVQRALREGACVGHRHESTTATARGRLARGRLVGCCAGGRRRARLGRACAHRRCATARSEQHRSHDCARRHPGEPTGRRRRYQTRVGRAGCPVCGPKPSRGPRSSNSLVSGPSAAHTRRPTRRHRARSVGRARLRAAVAPPVHRG